MRDGLAAGIGDGAIDIADGGSNKVFGGAHLEIGELEAGSVGRRSGGSLGLAAKKKREDDGDRNDDRHGHSDGAPAGIRLFGYRSWLDQAAHEGIVLCRLVAGLRLGLRLAQLEERGQEEHTEQQINAAECEILRVQAILQKKHEQGSSVAELLQHGRNHHRAEAHRISGNHEEHDLEGQAHTDEAVVERGMSDWRRIVPADHVEDEIKRCEDQHTPNTRDPEDDFGEFHVPASTHAAVLADGRGGRPHMVLLMVPQVSYSPPTVRPSMRRVGAATEPRNSRSLAISEMLKNISFRFPATVISSTG